MLSSELNYSQRPDLLIILENFTAFAWIIKTAGSAVLLTTLASVLAKLVYNHESPTSSWTLDQNQQIGNLGTA